MKPRFHGSECFCDSCSEARNKAADKYLQLTNASYRHGETYEERIDRIRRVCEAVELDAKGKS